MGLLGSLLGSSSKSSSTATTMTDNRRVLGDGAVSLEGGGSVVINNTDGGAVAAAQAVALGATAGMSALARDAVGQSLDFGGDALGHALDFGGDALHFGESALKTVVAAMGANDDRMARAYSGALDQMNDVNSRLGSAYADAKGQGAQTANMLMLAIAGVVLVGLFAVKRG